MQTVRNILQQQALNNDAWTEERKKEEIDAALDPTLDRKIKEMKLAIGLERNYSKEEILQGYLNIAGFGGNTYGVQAASEQYFGKDASDLTIAEAASLIAIVQYPNLRDLQDPEHYAANQERRDVILGSMYAWGMNGDEGCITRAEYDEASRDTGRRRLRASRRGQCRLPQREPRVRLHLRLRAARRRRSWRRSAATPKSVRRHGIGVATRSF